MIVNAKIVIAAEISNMKIALDPGHGMANIKSKVYDPGAFAANVSEADVVLSWVMAGKKELETAGFEVFLTRTSSTESSPLSSRVSRAVAAKSKIYISFHCNSSRSKTATGTETFYRDEKDKILAEKLQSTLLKVLKLRDRGLKTEDQSQHARLAVMEFPGPVALVELGFISNDQDRKKMLDKDLIKQFWKEFIVELKELAKIWS